MEGEERNPDRQDDFDERKLVLEAEQMGELVSRNDKEIEIFEDTEQGEVDGDCDAEHRAPLRRLQAGVDQQAGQIADH